MKSDQKKQSIDNNHHQHHQQNLLYDSSDCDDEGDEKSIKEKRREQALTPSMNNYNNTNSTNMPSYHHFKLPSTVLSKRERSIHNSSSSPVVGNITTSSSSGIYQHHNRIAISNSNSNRGYQENYHSCGEVSTSPIDVSNGFNIVDETDKTTSDNNKRMKKKRKKDMSCVMNYETKGQDLNGRNSPSLSNDEDDETLKVYAFEKPLLNNSSTFKDNYFILAPVSSSSAASSTNSNRKHTFSPIHHSPVHSAHLNSKKKQQLSPHPQHHQQPLAISPNSSYSSSSLNPSPNQVHSQSPIVVSNPIQNVSTPCSTDSDALSSRRLVLSEPTMTIYEKNQQTNASSNSPSPSNTNTTISSIPQNIQDSISMQIFSQMIQQLINRYQNQLDDLLQNPVSLVQNLLLGLNNQSNVGQIRNQQQYIESTPHEQYSPNLLQLSVEDLLSNNNNTASSQTGSYQISNNEYSIVQTQNPSPSVEEIFAFILQNQNLLSRNNNNSSNNQQ